MPITLPKWLTDPEGSNLQEMEADLTQTFRWKILEKLPDKDPTLARDALQAFDDMLQRLRIEGQAYIDAIDAFNEGVMPAIIEKDTQGIDPKRLDAEAKNSSLKAASAWHIMQDRYVLYVLSNAEEQGWWRYLDAGEFERFEEFLNDFANRARQENDLPAANRWQWIQTNLVPVLKQHGVSREKIIAACTVKGKLFHAISRMRMIQEQYAHDPEEAARMIVEIIEGEILNPDVSERQIRKKAPGFGKGFTPPTKIPAQATGYSITDGEGGGLVTIRFSNPAEARAIERAIAPLTDNPQAAMGVRDPIAMFNEVKEDIRAGHVDVQRQPLSEEKVEQLARDGMMELIIAIPLDALWDVAGKIVANKKIEELIGDNFGFEIKGFHPIRTMGREIQVKFSIYVFKSPTK